MTRTKLPLFLFVTQKRRKSVKPKGISQSDKKVEEWLTFEQTAKLLNCSLQQVKKLRYSEKLIAKSRKIGKKTTLLKKDVDDFLLRYTKP